MAKIETIKTRADFLAIRGGKRVSTAAFLIEARERSAARVQSDAARFGFTVTKKLGNAVTRNRIRRRLKAAVARLAPDLATPGLDYVIVARPAAETRPFADIAADLERALGAIRRSAQAGEIRSPKKDPT